MTRRLVLLFGLCLVAVGASGYETVEYLPDRVVVKYKTGEDIVTTAFEALKEYEGTTRPFIIQKSWLTEGEIEKLPTLLAYLKSLGFHPFIETVETQHNDKAEKLLGLIGGYLFERRVDEPAGICQDIAVAVCNVNSVMRRKSVTLDPAGLYVFEFHVDENTNPCRILLQTTNPKTTYRLIGPNGQVVNPAATKSTTLNHLLTLSGPPGGEWRLEVSGEGRHEMTVVGNCERTLRLKGVRSVGAGMAEIEVQTEGYDTSVYLVGEVCALDGQGRFQKKIFDHVDSGLCRATMPLDGSPNAIKLSLYSVRQEEKRLLREYYGVRASDELRPIFVSERPKGKVSASVSTLTAALMGGVAEDRQVIAKVDGRPLSSSMAQLSPIRKLNRTEITAQTPDLVEGDHHVEFQLTGLKGDVIARTSWTFTVDLPVSQSLLIDEVFFYGDNQLSWVELFALQDVDLAEYKLTDFDGSPVVLSRTKKPLKAGQYAVLYFADGLAMQGSGVTQIYLGQKKELSRTDDQLALLRGDAVVDAVAWSDKDGAIDPDEAEDLNALMAMGEWEAGSTVPRGKKGDSIGRKTPADSNKSSDFGAMPHPSPGRSNSNIVEGSHLGIPKPGAVLINEIHMSVGTSQDWAELYVVSGPVDLMEFTLTDMDGLDYRISSEPATLNTGEYAVIYWGAGTDGFAETDEEGDMNSNGVREFYLTDAKPGRTEDQLALIWEDTVIVDAVAWADGDGKFNKQELDDVLKLVSTQSWKIAFDGSENGMAILNKSDFNSVGRLPNGKDDNLPSDWGVLIRPTPGTPNLVTEKPIKGSILIYEVEPSTQKKDYAVLHCVKGPIDISSMTLTDLDGEDGKLSTDPVTLQTGEDVAVWWMPGASEVDGKGDVNGNGKRDIYLIQPDPSSSDDQAVLMLGSDIYDAVVFTNDDGKIDEDEMKDARFLIKSGEWVGSYDVQTNQRSSVNVGLYRLPIVRKSSTQDADSKEDWESRR